MSSRFPEVRRSTAGFTLVEVLVALSIVAVTLAPIGALISSAAHGAQTIKVRLSRLEIARAVITAMPDRDRLAPGNTSGEIAGYSWRVNVLPFAPGIPVPPARVPWHPQRIVVTVHSPSGDAIQVSTIRLQRKSGG